MDTQVATHQGCHLGFNIFQVPIAEVKKLVPERYTIQSDPGGSTANVTVDPFSCNSITTGATAEPASGAFVGVAVCPQAHLDGGNSEDVATGTCTSVIDPSVQYLLFLVTDSRSYGTGIDVTYASDLVHQFSCPPDPCEAGSYDFQVPGAKPGPFRISGIVAAQETLAVKVPDTLWFLQDTTGPQGDERTAVFSYDSHFDFFAPSTVTLVAAEESEMAKVMGTTKTTPAFSLPHWIPTFNLEKSVVRH